MSFSRTQTRLASLVAMLGAAYVGRRFLRARRKIDLVGKVAVVTGATRGLGFLIARELAREGCKIVIAARDPRELEKARDRLRLEGVPVWSVVADLTDKDQAENVIMEARHYFGGIDILVNNAGQIQVAPLDAVNENHFRSAMDLTFWGTLHTSLAVIPHMRARGSGSIVNITSFGGLVAMPHMLPYSSAKFAQFGLSQGLHAELARHGIAVTTVAPGTMRTGGHVQARFGGQQEKEYAWFALGASLPGISTDAERAARQIVAALKHKTPFLVIGAPFSAAVRLSGLFPGITAEVLGVANRLLPSAPPVNLDPAIEGSKLKPGILLRAATTLGERARLRFQ